MSKLRTAVILFSVIVIFGFYYVDTHSFAYGAMMGGMGGGMMGSQEGSNDESPKTVNASSAKVLLKYIQDEHLQCMQCHAISKNMVGPSFALISARNKEQKDAMLKLSNHIAHGVGRMPPGLANEQQARTLAKQILELTIEPSNSKQK